MLVQMKLEGVTEVVAQLNGLKRGLRNRILRKALKAGAKVIGDLARGKVNRGPAVKGKHLKQSIKGTVSTARVTGAVTAWVRASAPHAALVELGHKGSVAGSKQTGGRKKNVSITGKRALTIRDAGGNIVALRRSTKAVPPHPFMQPAVDAGKVRCVAAIAEVIDVELGKLRAKEFAALVGP
jgi:HK97 gp10 family phage protein